MEEWYKQTGRDQWSLEQWRKEAETLRDEGSAENNERLMESALRSDADASSARALAKAWETDNQTLKEENETLKAKNKALKRALQKQTGEAKKAKHT